MASHDDKRRVVLVLDGDGWPSRTVARSLGSAGWRVVSERGTKCARSRFCEQTVELPSYHDHADAFAEGVARAIRTYSVDLVSPAEDASLELLYETDGLLGDARVLGGDRRSAQIATDKTKTLAHAREADFPTPAYAVPEDAAAAVEAAREIGFPCAVKPRRSYGRLGARRPYARHKVAHTPDDVRRAVEWFVANGFELPIVQAWTPGTSIGVGAVVRGGRVLAWGAREAYRQWPPSGGVAVWRRTVGVETPGVAAALQLLVDIGFEGLGDVQYHITADGTPKLMELGARVYGWLPLTVLAGADLPLVAARSFEGVEPPETIVARAGIEMRWILGELQRLRDALRPRPPLPPNMRRRDVFRELWPLWRPTMHYDGIAVGDGRLSAAAERLSARLRSRPLPTRRTA
jgi:carbamoyl-phosphate synthase large subunit